MTTSRRHPYPFPSLEVGEHREIKAENTKSLRTVLGRKAKRRGWKIACRSTTHGVEVYRLS